MAIYLKMDGVDGDVTEDSHKKWIAVDSFQLGVGRGVSTPVGDAKSREASMPSISEITVTKQMDGASPNLLGLALSDTSGKKVLIEFVKAGKTNEIYLHYELTNTLISGYSISSGGDRPSESLSLNFTKIQEKYSGYDEENKNPNPVIKGYDLATGKVV
jgi:type VI secretion system secreted protein Hcp